jgi:hypothetical protein
MNKSDKEAIRNFNDVAARYCKIIETHKSLSRARLLREIGKILPSLYSAAWNLPPTKISSVGLLTERLTDDRWGNLFHALQRKLGSCDVYNLVFDPIHDKEAIAQCLADDLADIYRELHNYLLAPANRLGDAVWEIRLGFESHWGSHLTNALNVIHELQFHGGEGPWPRRAAQ